MRVWYIASYTSRGYAPAVSKASHTRSAHMPRTLNATHNNTINEICSHLTETLGMSYSDALNVARTLINCIERPYKFYKPYTYKRNLIPHAPSKKGTIRPPHKLIPYAGKEQV